MFYQVWKSKSNAFLYKSSGKEGYDHRNYSHTIFCEIHPGGGWGSGEKIPVKNHHSFLYHLICVYQDFISSFFTAYWVFREKK